MNFILQLLLNAGIILGMTYIMRSIKVKNFSTAILVALVLGLLNATIGWIIRFPLNVVTLGLLSFAVHIVVTAIMIKIADLFFSGFEIKGFTPAILIALVMGVLGAMVSYF